MLTLWDLIEPVIAVFRPKPPPAAKPARPGRRRENSQASQPQALKPERQFADRLRDTPQSQQPSRPRAASAVKAKRPRRSMSASQPNGSESTAMSPPLSPSHAERDHPSPGHIDPNEPAQDRYDRVVREMLTKHTIKVRRWRSSMSGVAWQLRYRDGRVVNMLESPKPKGPMSAAVFLHEVGHHAIGLGRYKPRCLEEYHAWRWSLEAMQCHGIAITDAVKHRMAESLWYAVAKARRRGLRELPEELLAFQTRPPKRKRGSE